MSLSPHSIAVLTFDVVITLIFIAWRVRMYFYHRQQNAALREYIKDMQRLSEWTIKIRQEMHDRSDR